MVLALLLALQTDIVKGEPAKTLDAHLTKLGADKFSGTVLVAIGGKIVLEKGYGPAAAKRPNGPATMHDIGSVTKQFTAAAIVKLEMQGKLKVTDLLNAHLAGVPDDKKQITLHQLLNHTSGMAHDADLGQVNWGDEAASMKALLASPMKSEPGEKFVYNNRAYDLLAAVVAKASGDSYEDYVKKHLFKPAVMKSSGFCGDTDRKETDVAHGYEEGKDLGSGLEAPYGWGHRGATGALCTAADLYRWHQALNGDKVLSKEAKKKMFAPGKGDYGYGWFIRKTDRGKTLIQHGGATRGFQCTFDRYVDDDVVVIVLMNQFGKLFDVTPDIERIVFSK